MDIRPHFWIALIVKNSVSLGSHSENFRLEEYSDAPERRSMSIKAQWHSSTVTAKSVLFMQKIVSLIDICIKHIACRNCS